MAPHIARRLVGSSFGALLPVAALIGGLLVLIADIIGRTLSPVEVPAGVFTAAIGAPTLSTCCIKAETNKRRDFIYECHFNRNVKLRLWRNNHY